MPKYNKVMCNNNLEVEEVVEDEVAQMLDLLNSSSLILYNDDHNSFDHVITCLVKYCKHTELQAEQCALIVHQNGKCDVKSGPKDELVPICTALLDNGLTAKIE